MSAGATTKDYVRTWLLLLVLFIISVCGPLLEIKWVTLITAFGIAFVKAYIVAARFMHLKIEKKIILWMLLSMILLMIVYFYGVAPDVMVGKGTNWEKVIDYKAHYY